MTDRSSGDGQPPEDKVVWLEDDRTFSDVYKRIAEVLATRTATRAVVDDKALLAAYRRWQDKVFADFGTGAYTTYDSGWDHSLRELAVILCAANCVTYVSRRSAYQSRQTERRLLIENPAIFTGLQFVRTQFLRLFIEDDVVTVHDKFLQLGHDIEPAIEIVKAHPAEAGDFISLLNLHNFRKTG